MSISKSGRFKIALLPLDDRPCNLEAVEDLGKIARIDVVTPPRVLLDTRENIYNFERTLTWFDEVLRTADAAIISLDFFLYGGLVRSRKLDLSQGEALERLAKLDTLLTRYPKVSVYLSHVLLRLSVTVTADQPESVWRNVFRFSELSDPAIAKEARPEIVSELETLRKNIPSKILEEYLQVRARNHALNRAALGLAGRAKLLLYGQEDCAPQGLHRAEKNSLRELIGARGNVHVMTGADELNSLLVYCAYQNSRPAVGGARPLTFTVPELESLDAVSLYEDVSLRTNLEAHLAPTLFRARYRSGDDGVLPSVPVIAIFPFGSGGQPDACFLDAQALDRMKLNSESEKQISQLRPGDGILDFSLANGANPELAKQIFAQHPERLDEVCVFSAWNTSGNRIGTTLAHWGIRLLAQERSEYDPHSDRWYRFSQLLDGWLFQSVVRPKLIAKLSEQKKNIWALSPQDRDEQSQMVNQELQSLCKIVFSHSPSKNDMPHFRAELPWNRLFEVRISPIN